MIINVIISFLVPDIASYYDGKLISGKVIVKPLKQAWFYYRVGLVTIGPFWKRTESTYDSSNLD